MSELTSCNFCSLRSMKRRAAARGVTVIVKKESEGVMKGWTSARYSDRDKPSAHFMELTDRCAC
jgi:hypothetical protein